MGVCGAFFFVLQALDVAQVSPRVAWAVRISGTLAGSGRRSSSCWACWTTRAPRRWAWLLGPAPLLLVLPTAFKRLRAGDRAALYVLLGWGF